MKSLKTPDQRSVALAIAMIVIALATAVLAWLSAQGDALITPWGSYGVAELGAQYYMGISVYITISATLFTAAAIRIALRASK